MVTMYSLGFCIIKYREGYTFMPDHGIVPTPYQMWPQSEQAAIFPLTLLFAIAWSFEMVTHLEELCFWLFLVNASTTQQDWFRSYYFRTWTVGSVVAVVYMPLVTIFTRGDKLRCEAFTFLAGSLGSLSLTLWFMPILWTFPSFLQNLRNEGADMNTIARLTKFHELNTLRVIFRFIFVVPLLLLGVDGIRPHQHLNESMAVTDVLAMLAAIGCMISSAMTLVIFFPRQIQTEIQVKEAKKTARTARSHARTHSHSHSHSHSDSHSHSGGKATYLLEQNVYELQHPNPWDAGDEQKLPPLSPNRRQPDDVEMAVKGGRLSERNLRKHDQRMSKYNRLVHNYTSPIDLMS